MRESSVRPQSDFAVEPGSADAEPSDSIEQARDGWWLEIILITCLGVARCSGAPYTFCANISCRCRRELNTTVDCDIYIYISLHLFYLSIQKSF